MYNPQPPPTKRRRIWGIKTSNGLSFDHPQHIYANQMTSNLNHNSPSHPPQVLPASRIMHPDLQSFQSQLQGVLNSFPPLAEFISSQTNPNPLFSELFDVFSSSAPNHASTHGHESHNIMYTSPSHSNHAHVCTCDKNHNQLQSAPSIPPKPPFPPTPSTASTATSDSAQSPVIPPPPDSAAVSVFDTARDQIMQKVYFNLELRCGALIKSLNETITKHHKYAPLFKPKHFVMNAHVKKEIFDRMANTLKTWDGGNLTQRVTPLTNQKANKLVSEYWNRQKALQFGDALYSLVLQNLFEISLRVPELRPREQVMFYIDLFCGMLSDYIHFERSKPRPILLSGCFDRSLRFRSLCQNVLDAFSSGALKMVKVYNKEERAEQTHSGKTVLKFVRCRTKSAFVAESYFNSLQHLKNMVSKASETYLQHSVQLHLNWLKSSGYQPLHHPFQLIQWVARDQCMGAT
eukprot:196782_1